MGTLGQRIDIASPFFRATTNDALILRQRVEMILGTRPGTYWKSPEYGFPVDDLVNAEMSPEAFARIAARIKRAIQGDTFFREATVSVAITNAKPQPSGLVLSAVVSIALPSGEPQRVEVQISPAGTTVLGG